MIKHIDLNFFAASKALFKEHLLAEMKNSFVRCQENVSNRPSDVMDTGIVLMDPMRSVAKMQKNLRSVLGMEEVV